MRERKEELHVVEAEVSATTILLCYYAAMLLCDFTAILLWYYATILLLTPSL